MTELVDALSFSFFAFAVIGCLCYSLLVTPSCVLADRPQSSLQGNFTEETRLWPFHTN